MKNSLKILHYMNRQDPLKKQYLLLSFLLFLTINITAQNKHYDWSIGLYPSILSYSAVAEGKLSNPYEYTVGSSVGFSRYLNNNFDLSIEGSRANVRYPVNSDKQIYEEGLLYDANFALRYKLDNGYILKENFVVGPYVKFGIGGNQVSNSSGLDYFLPVGLGLNVTLGKHASLNLQSSLKYDLSGPNSYAHHSLGFMIHFGKAGRKRVVATRIREQKRKYARIRKYRANQRMAKYNKAQNRLKNLKKSNLSDSQLANQNVEEDIMPPVSVEPDMETELAILEEESPRLEPENPIIPEPKSTKKKKSESVEAELNEMLASEEATNTEPVIPQPPKRRTVDENPLNVVIGDAKPPMPKPKKVTVETTLLADIMDPETTSTSPKPPNALNLPKEEQAYCENSEDMLTRLGKQVTFDKDRYRVRSRTHKHLKQIVKVLSRCDAYSYVIIAHTDKDGDADYNRRLSAKRADAIKDYLTKQGVDTARLLTVAYGESLADADKEQQKALNRNISFKINRSQIK